MSRLRNRSRKKKKQKQKRGRKGPKPSSRNVGRRQAPVATTQIIRNRGVARSVRIKHKEFVEDLDCPATSGNFSTLAINPGLEAQFPWLSAVAMRFESYRWNSLTFVYVPSTATSTVGSLLLAPDYDADDDNSSASKSELLAFEDSVRGAWWTTFACKCSLSNLHKRKEFYVRGTDVAHDLKAYDALQLNIMKAGTSAINGVGELWVEYDITLITPQKKHYSEQLEGRRIEIEVSISGFGGVSTVYVDDWSSTIPWYDGMAPYSTTAAYIGLRTPGVYAFSMCTDTTASPDALATWYNGPITSDDHDRDGSVSMISNVVASGNTQASTDCIIIVEETASYPEAYFEIYPFSDGGYVATVADGNTHNFYLTMTELTYESGRRALSKFKNLDPERKRRVLSYLDKHKKKLPFKLQFPQTTRDKRKSLMLRNQEVIRRDFGSQSHGSNHPKLTPRTVVTSKLVDHSLNRTEEESKLDVSATQPSEDHPERSDGPDTQEPGNSESLVSPEQLTANVPHNSRLSCPSCSWFTSTGGFSDLLKREAWSHSLTQRCGLCAVLKDLRSLK